MKVNKQAVAERLCTLEDWLSDGANLQDRAGFAERSKEHSYLSELMDCTLQIESLVQRINETQHLLATESDAEFLALAEQELTTLKNALESIEQRLRDILVPPRDDDDAPTILELRAGAGGQEAMLFVADCARMYQMYGVKLGWKVECLSAAPSDLGGCKEYTMAVSGKNAWRFLHHEGGTHRVQRVPLTEAQGRVHTSTITVAALQKLKKQTRRYALMNQTFEWKQPALLALAVNMLTKQTVLYASRISLPV